MSTEICKSPSLYLNLLLEKCIHNKYALWCSLILERAIQRQSLNDSIHTRKREFENEYGYGEKHHLWPSCLCSKEQKSDRLNLVMLTIREHFIVHLLLTKMFSTIREKNSMFQACHRMTFQDRMGKIGLKISSRLSSYLKSNFRLAAKQRLQDRQEKKGLTKGLSKYKNTKTLEIRLFKRDDTIPHGWVPFNRGMIVAKDIISGEKVLVSKEEFDKNKNLVGHSAGYSTVINKSTGEKERILTADYDKNLYRYNTEGNRFSHSKEVRAKMKGTFCVKHIDGRTKRTHVNDPDLNSGEWGVPGSRVYNINGKLFRGISYVFGRKFLKRIQYLFRNSPVGASKSFVFQNENFLVIKMSQ